MPKSGWIGALLPLLAFSMTLGAQSPQDWSGVKRFFRQQISDAGIVGASLVIVREGKIEADEYVGYQEGSHAAAGRSRHHLSLGLNHQDFHRHRHHAATRSRTAGSR
jgi:hypothetical protein